MDGLTKEQLKQIEDKERLKEEAKISEQRNIRLIEEAKQRGKERAHKHGGIVGGAFSALESIGRGTDKIVGTLTNGASNIAKSDKTKSLGKSAMGFLGNLTKNAANIQYTDQQPQKKHKSKKYGRQEIDFSGGIDYNKIDYGF